MTTETSFRSSLHPTARPLLVAAGAAFLVTTVVWVTGFAEYPDDGVAGSDFSPAADAQDPGLVTGGWIALAGSLLLLLAISALSTHRGSSGRSLPAYAAIMGLIGAVAGVNTFYGGVVYERFFASLAPAAYDAAYGDYPLSYAVPYYGVLVLFALGLAVFGIGGARARLFSRSAAALLVVGAFAIPTVGPVAIGLAGIGTLLAARRPAAWKNRTRNESSEDGTDVVSSSRP